MMSLSVLLLVCLTSSRLVCCLPPRMDVEENLVIRTEEQDDFELLCEGDQPLKWAWNSSLLEEYVDIKDGTQPLDKYPYTSTLTVYEVVAGDTGFYHCHYGTLTDSDNVASSYIYVYDGEKIFVKDKPFYSINVKTNEKLNLDCRTTLPNATVALEKDGNKITDSFNMRWDPKIGFILLSLTIHDSGAYTCLYEPNGATIIYRVNVLPATTSKPTPSIDEGANPHYALGHPFSLECTLKGDVAEASLVWIYPNSGVKHNTSQDREENSVMSTLHVLNASNNDSGTYTCKAAYQFEATQDSLDIQIKDVLKPYVTINSTDKITVDLHNTTTLKWKAVVHSFPLNPIITYKNWQGEILTDNDRIDVEFEREEAFSWLILHNITAEDFGTYTLTASTADASANHTATLHLQINSEPEVKIEGVPEYLWPESKVGVRCSVQGFPRPSLVWLFQSCVNGRPSCSPYQELQVTEGSVNTPGPGNILQSSFDFLATSSGFLQCVANNSLATVNHTVPVYISDIGGIHVLSHTGQNTTTIATTATTTTTVVLSVITNDDFLLTCGANKLLYKNVTLRTPQGYPGQVKERVSKYSLVQETTLDKVTPPVQGKYVCTADTHTLNQRAHTKSIQINVLEEAEVTFLQDSNMENKTYTVNESPFFLNCTVAGTPHPTVTWTKDGKLLTYTSGFFDNKTTFLSSNSQRIEFKYEFKDKHVGHYICTAKNRVNTLVRSMLLQIPVPGLSTSAKIGLAVALVGIAILIITVVILFKRVKTERRFRKSFRANELYLFEKGNMGQLNPDCSADEQAELLPYGQEWEVNRDQISLGKQLGSGAFGRVVKAKVSGLEGPATTTVAIKMCKSQADQAQIRALALELKIMIHLGKHLNIVNLMGANTTHIGKGELWILVEYCRFGNLLVFMHRNRRNFINQIDAKTGHIDVTKLTPDAPNNSSWRGGVNSRGSASHDMPTLPISPPPIGHGIARQQVHNPMYSPMSPIHPPQSPQSSHFPWPDETTQDAGSDCNEGGDLKTPATSISTASDGRVQNLYFTSSSTSSGSHAPLSPTETSLLDSHGNTLVHEVGNVPGVNCPFTTSHLVCWSWQVAHGMDYLASRKVLHGDLAARNLLLANDNVVKISDFGLSRDIYKKDIYMKKTDDLMPIKWISVEAIRDRIFSVQSDVWALGVTLWEIFSLGSNPYPGIEVNMDFLPLLEDGYRMACPKYANQDIYDLLLECWEAEPMDRPSFREAVHRLDSLMQPEVKGEYLSMNDQYMRMNEERFKEQPDYLSMFSPPDYENMTNKGVDDDLKPHYVNMEVAGGDGTDTIQQLQPQPQQQQATIQSPEMVSYHNTNLTPSPASVSSNQNPHYLPMDCVTHSSSPVDEVFSPDPTQDSRFSFTKNDDNITTSKEDYKPFLNNHEQK